MGNWAPSLPIKAAVPCYKLFISLCMHTALTTAAAHCRDCTAVQNKCTRPGLIGLRSDTLVYYGIVSDKFAAREWEGGARAGAEGVRGRRGRVGGGEAARLRGRCGQLLRQRQRRSRTRRTVSVVRGARRMMYDVSSALFRSFVKSVGSSGGTSEKGVKVSNQRIKLSDNKPVMND